MSFKGITGYNRDDLHIQIIDYRQFLHILPICCELSDNLKKDFLLLLYHTQSHLSTQNVRSGCGQKYYNIFLTNYYKQNIIIFYYSSVEFKLLPRFSQIPTTQLTNLVVTESIEAEFQFRLPVG